MSDPAGPSEHMRCRSLMRRDRTQRSSCRAPASAQGLFDFLFRAAAPGPAAQRQRLCRSAPIPAQRRSASAAAGPSGIGGHVLRAAVRRALLPDPARRAAPIPRSSAIRSARRPRPDVLRRRHRPCRRQRRQPLCELRNAFAYRERIVDNCTCNGRDPYGLVTLNRPTIRRCAPATSSRPTRASSPTMATAGATPSSRRSSPIPACRRNGDSGWRRPGSRRTTRRRSRRRRCARRRRRSDDRDRRVQLDR